MPKCVVKDIPPNPFYKWANKPSGRVVIALPRLLNRLLDSSLLGPHFSTRESPELGGTQEDPRHCLS